MGQTDRQTDGRIAALLNAPNVGGGIMTAVKVYATAVQSHNDQLKATDLSLL